MFYLIIISTFLCNSLTESLPSVSFFYPKNLTVSTCTGDYSWTKWFNSAKPKHDQDFDQEFLSIIQTENGRDICEKPQGIQAQTVTALQTDITYAVSWKIVNGIIKAFISRTAGIDFQVRFCCLNNDFIPTTTKIPRPIIDYRCGRTQIKPQFLFTRIFGGSFAIPHSWPWQVLYEEENVCEMNRTCIDTCGGTLIDAYHVLTAAHCIRRKNSKYIQITLGVHYRFDDESVIRQKRNINRIFIHPNWDNETYANDLAILQFTKPIEFNKYVQPACLPGPDPQLNSDMILIGWGAERIDGNLHNQLKQAQVKIIDECQKYWNLFDEENQICVGQIKSGDSACQGDSGGPLLQQYNDQWIVHGVASFVDDCKTNENYPPNVYVKVSAYLSWIYSIIN